MDEKDGIATQATGIKYIIKGDRSVNSEKRGRDAFKDLETGADLLAVSHRPYLPGAGLKLKESVH